MQVYQALILGVVQGLTELLPVSSSAHLNVIPWLLGWTENTDFMIEFSGSFDVALHFGTLIAIGIFFFKDWPVLDVCVEGNLKIKFVLSSKKRNFNRWKNVLVYSYCDNTSRHFSIGFR